MDENNKSIQPSSNEVGRSNIGNKRSFLRRFWWLILLSLILIAGTGLFLLRGNTNPQQSGYNPASNKPSKQTRPVFSHKMFDLDKVQYLMPLGELNGGYVEVQPLNSIMVQLDPAKIKDSPIEVFAPTDIELFMYANTSSNDQPGGDWSLDFSINDDVNLTVHHLNDASDKITSILGDSPIKDDSRGINLKTPIKFKAGDLIGTTRGTSLGKNWNIYVYDKNVENKFINQSRYKKDIVGERLLTSTCPFDYYEDPAVKDSYYALLGASKPGQTDNCGNPSKDKEGTLSGLWHLTKDGGVEEGYEGNYGGPLSVYIRSDENVIIYELGKTFFTIDKNKPSYKNPEEIDTSHCYSLADDWSMNIKQGYAYFRIDSKTEMSVSYSPTGTCPAEFPSTFQQYYR